MTDKRVTLQEVLAAYEPKRRLDKGTKNIYLVRKPSLLVTPFFVNIGMTANLTTLLSFLTGMASMVFLALGGITNGLIGWAGLYIEYLLDCIDGNIARTLKVTSFFGKFIDGLSDGISGSMKYMAIGIGMIHMEQARCLLHWPGYLWPVIGGIGTFASLATIYTGFRYRYTLLEMANLHQQDSGAKVKIEVKQKAKNNQKGFFHHLEKGWAAVYHFIEEIEWPLLLPALFLGLDLYLLVVVGANVVNFIVNALRIFRQAYGSLNYRRPY